MASAAIHFLTATPFGAAAESGLRPALRDWFAANIGAPTLAQRHAWPAILDRKNFILSSPTGSGKTLAAFMPIVSEVLAQPSAGLQALYIAPLKALCRDACVNLKRLRRSLRDMGIGAEADLRIGLRTGETSQCVRQRQRIEPPAILLTTPESLAQMLAHEPSHEMFRSLRWVIVDEIHALIGSKRGADLAICLERLEALRWRSGSDDDHELQRIGLSATCAPLATVARFLVGVDRPCAVAQVADSTQKHFVVEPLFDLIHGEQALTLHAALLERLDAELAACQTALVFTNTRHLAERLTWALKRRHPQRSDQIAVHHSAISAARRRSVERRLKQDKLWTVVSSTSLELGIDIGSVDRVIFVHPPGGVVRLLQRVGRSGHRPDEPKHGLLLTASPGELLEAAVTAASGRDGQIEPVALIAQPFDVLCQQIVGMAMTGLWSRTAAFELIRRAAPFSNLSSDDFNDCLDYLSGRRRDGLEWLPVRLTWEGDCFTIADARTAKLLRRNLGTILTQDSCAIRLRVPTRDDAANTQPIGEVDQVYAERLQFGDRFVLDGRCLELIKRDDTALLVDEVFGRPQIPRWLGSGVPMSSELAQRIFLFRVQAAEAMRDGDEALRHWLQHDFELNESAVVALAEYVRQQETVSETPTLTALLIESVAMQACTEYFVHTPLPRAANEVLARVLMDRWIGKGAAAALAVDLGVYLLVQSATPIDAAGWRQWLHPQQFAEEFSEHLARSELLPQAFARVAQTGLMVLRNPAWRQRKVGGKDWPTRRLYDTLRERCPDFVLLRQSEAELLTGACDLEAARKYVDQLASLPIRIRTLRTPSPFGANLLRVGMRSESITSETREAVTERMG